MKTGLPDILLSSAPKYKEVRFGGGTFPDGSVVQCMCACATRGQNATSVWIGGSSSLPECPVADSTLLVMTQSLHSFTLDLHVYSASL